MKTVRPPKGATHYRLACKNEKCNAAMECEEKELEFVSDQRDGNAYVLTCPHCETKTWFAVEAIKKYAVRPS